MPRLKKQEIATAEPKSAELLKDLESKKLLLNIFKGMANSPNGLNAYLQLSGALRGGQVDAKTGEAVALAVAQTNRCEYCLAAHTFIGKHAGLTDTLIADARRGKSADAKINAAVALSRKIQETRGAVADADLAAARAAGLTDGQIVELVAHVALNIYTNFFNNLNQTEVDLPKVAVDL